MCPNMKFYTLVEIAQEVGVPQHVLAYWLKKWQINETSRVATVRIYSAEKFGEIKRMVEAARSVNSFASMKCPSQNSNAFGDVSGN